MKTKIYYYNFKKCDTCFIAMVLALIIAIFFGCSVTLGLFFVAAFIWGYKNILKQKAVVITDDGITINHSNILPWKDVKETEIKTVTLCGKLKKILSLTPKESIKYNYNYLQQHNVFGPFPIPLYGILTTKDEREIIKEVKKHIKVNPDNSEFTTDMNLANKIIVKNKKLYKKLSK